MEISTGMQRHMLIFLNIFLLLVEFYHFEYAAEVQDNTFLLLQ